MLQNPDPESKRIFWQPLCTCFILMREDLERQAAFLVLSAFEADDQPYQPWTLK